MIFIKVIVICGVFCKINYYYFVDNYLMKEQKTKKCGVVTPRIVPIGILS